MSKHWSEFVAVTYAQARALDKMAAAHGKGDGMDLLTVVGGCSRSKVGKLSRASVAALVDDCFKRYGRDAKREETPAPPDRDASVTVLHPDEPVTVVPNSTRFTADVLPRMRLVGLPARLTAEAADRVEDDGIHSDPSSGWIVLEDQGHGRKTVLARPALDPYSPRIVLVERSEVVLDTVDQDVLARVEFHRAFLASVG